MPRWSAPSNGNGHGLSSRWLFQQESTRDLSWIRNIAIDAALFVWIAVIGGITREETCVFIVEQLRGSHDSHPRRGLDALEHNTGFSWGNTCCGMQRRDVWMRGRTNSYRFLWNKWFLI